MDYFIAYAVVYGGGRKNCADIFKEAEPWVEEVPPTLALNNPQLRRWTQNDQFSLNSVVSGSMNTKTPKIPYKTKFNNFLNNILLYKLNF